MSIWLYINILLFITVLFSLADQYAHLPIHIMFGLAGLFLILFNWTRHAFFSTIRNTPDRKKKIKLATISKRIYPFHRWVGTTALLLIILHAAIIIHRFGFLWMNMKMWSGVGAIITLICMVLSGWFRLYFPSVKKRRMHIIFGFLLFFFVALHTVLF
ncbi:hypothetical protein [Oceanobacillus alkalisoli]|uniref:hypothetical protein n=1 Tax=Oceanobacillus alkalisoli TaxID=2925113 RepID=UPI001EF15B04|nr:hypothetical protein [Oceanobacillus alkalisoli]MCF3942136.1 hypothetical protein [Oceanobacillus alkalisoli]MCG5104370.1 hypothetical protein [Oceanobacillus alkalisoli]